MVKIKINYLFFVLMILGIFEPAYFEDGNLHIFFVVCKLISLIFLFDFIKRYKLYKSLAGKKFIIYLFLVLIFFILILKSISVTKTGSFSYVLNLIDTFAYVVANCVFYTKYNKDIFYIYKKLMGSLLILNFLTLFSENFTYFLGHKNAITMYIILYLFGCLGTIGYSNATNNIRWLFIIFILLIYSIIFDCSTAIGCVLVVGAGIFGSRIKNYKGVIKTFILICVVAGLLVYYSGYLDSVVSFITGILSRSSTFTGRKAVWSWSVNYIQKSPVFGHGTYIEFTPWSNIYKHVYSAHNIFLDVSCRFGIISAVLLIIPCLYTLKCLIKKLTYINFSKITLLLSLILYSLMEAGSMALFMAMITFYVYSYFVEENKIIIE